MSVQLGLQLETTNAVAAAAAATTTTTTITTTTTKLVFDYAFVIDHASDPYVG